MQIDRIRRGLVTSRAAQTGEIALVFLVAVAAIAIGWRIVGEAPFARQIVVFVANLLMLGAIWAGLHVRGQTWEHFGLSLRWRGWRALARTVLQSGVILVLALAAFVAGAVVMQNVAAAPTTADMSSYDYLRGSLPMLLVSLAAVYVVSSFGEEALYRGFLINRLAEIGGGTRGAWGLAAAASTVIFGLVHFDWGVVGVVQTTFMGLALAVSYLVTKRNLWALVLAHAYMDTLLLVQLYQGAPAGAAE